MSNEDRKEVGGGTKKPTSFVLSWAILRKIESLIFLAMFLAVPLFALRVLQYTHARLVVRNVAQSLTNDLQRAKAMSLKQDREIEVTGTSSKKEKYYSYYIRGDSKILEEVVLPEHVSVVGTVTFEPSGHPIRPSSFIVSSYNRTATVEIDKAGLVSAP